jgi:hypothetical protein
MLGLNHADVDMIRNFGTVIDDDGCAGAARWDHATVLSQEIEDTGRLESRRGLGVGDNLLVVTVRTTSAMRNGQDRHEGHCALFVSYSTYNGTR